MSKENDGGSAFPQSMVDFGKGPEEPEPYGMGGMSLRDYFSGQAESAWIQALAQRRHEPGYSDESAACEAARLAVISADAMLAEREK